MAADAVELHHHHADDVGALRDLVGDAQGLLDGQAVGGLVVQRREVVHARDEGDALDERPVLHVLLDTGVQEADTAPGLRDGLAVELQDQAQHAVRGRVLRTHVDDDALLLAVGRRDDAVPVAAGDGVDAALGRAVRAGLGEGDVVGSDALGSHVVGGHQLYDLRWSGGGVVAPLYSTGTPPSG